VYRQGEPVDSTGVRLIPAIGLSPGDRHGDLTEVPVGTRNRPDETGWEIPRRVFRITDSTVEAALAREVRRSKPPGAGAE
jgi:hypothetical protein